MKKLPILLFVLITACNNATDGDADTDTTNFPQDTNLLNAQDTADHINSNTGTISTDTTQRPSPDGASKSRQTTSTKKTKSAPNDPARIDTMKQ